MNIDIQKISILIYFIIYNITYVDNRLFGIVVIMSVHIQEVPGSISGYTLEIFLMV